MAAEKQDSPHLDDDADRTPKLSRKQKQTAPETPPEPAKINRISANLEKRISKQSSSSQRKGRSSGIQRFSQYEAVPGVKVKDFAYPPIDPRHYGLPLADDSQSNRSSGSDWFSSSSDEDETASYGSAERLFESDEDEHRSQEQTRQHKTRHADVEIQVMDTVVLPHLARELKEHLGDIDLAFYRAKALFDFQKVTEWEMTISEGEGLVIAFVESPQSNQDKSPSNETTETAEETTQSQDEKESEVPRDGDDMDANTPTGSRSSGLNERWASIDQVAGDLLTMIHGGSKSDMLEAPDLVLLSDPPPEDLAAQLNQLLDYSGVYGAGWATAVRFKCRGKVADGNETEADKAKNGSQGSHKGKVKIKVLDMGLVPGNYIEKV